MNGGKRVVPTVTVALLIGATVASFFSGGLDSILLYRAGDAAGDRSWSLWSAHLVHFSAAHFCWDALALALLGAWLERRIGSRRLLCLTFRAAPVVVLGTMGLEPGLAGYGGFSGLACAYAGAAAAVAIGRGGEARTLGLLLAGALAAKIGWELAHPGAAVFLGSGSGAFRPVASAHAVGAVIGAGSELGRALRALPAFGGTPRACGAAG